MKCTAVAHLGLSHSSPLSFRVPFRVRSDLKTPFRSLNSYPISHPRTNRLPISFLRSSLPLFIPLPFVPPSPPFSPSPSAHTHATTTYMCWSRRRQHCLPFRSLSASYRLPPSLTASPHTNYHSPVLIQLPHLLILAFFRLRPVIERGNSHHRPSWHSPQLRG